MNSNSTIQKELAAISSLAESLHQRATGLLDKLGEHASPGSPKGGRKKRVAEIKAKRLKQLTKKSYQQ